MISSETITHAIKTGAGRDELSLEEQAIKGLETDPAVPQRHAEEDETAALAEGRVKPPKSQS